MTCTHCNNAIFADTVRCAYCGTWQLEHAGAPRQAHASADSQPFRPVSFAPTESVWAPQPPPATEVQSDVHENDDWEHTRLSIRRTATQFWAVDLPDGTCEVIVGNVVLGRAPLLESHWLPGRALRVANASSSLSKSHVLFSERDGAIVVRDLFSCNGVIVSQAGHHEVDLVAGARLVVTEDCTLELGDVIVGLRRL